MDSLNKRERLLVFASTCAIVLFSTLHFSILPSVDVVSSSSKKYKELKAENETQNAVHKRLSSAANIDPNKKADSELMVLQAKLKSIDNSTSGLSESFTMPESMPQIMALLTTNTSGFLVTEVITEPSARQGIDGDSKNRLFAHDITIRGKGEFGNLLSYVSNIEKSAPKLIFDRLRFSISENGLLDVEIVIYLLSTKEEVFRVK